jgi:raffinose synthase
MNSSLVQRNTEDYFSWDGSEKFWQKHVMMNAYNNIFTSQYALPDWDMFDSKHPDAEFQAAARAISGGPIYFADKPEDANAEIIKKLAYSDGTVLRCSQPALVAEDSLFVDPNKEKELLKIFNMNNEIGVLGLFHCLYDEEKKPEAITGQYSPKDVHGIQGLEFAVYHQTSGQVEILEKNEIKNISLEYMNHQLLTISPIKNGIAPLGLLDKLNGSRVITSFSIQNGMSEIKVEQGGCIGIYCHSKPASLKVNGGPQRFKYNDDSKLLLVEISEKHSVIIIGESL